MRKRVGLLVGAESSLERELLDRCRQLPGVAAELVEIGGVSEGHINRQDLIVDLVSHHVRHYRQFLKAAALAGATVINDPFLASSADKFFALSLAARLGAKVPRTVMLPQKSYGPAVDVAHGLRNLEFPLRWDKIVGYVKLPAVLRPADRSCGRSWPVHDHDGLIGAFDLSADRVMMLQNRIEPRWSLRCLCIGGEHGCVLDLKSGRRAWGEAEDDDWLPPAIREQVVSQSLKISGALGYDINAVDLVVGEQGAYVVDASNPAPELDIEVLGERAFRQVVRWLVALVGERARSAERTIDRYRWAREI